MVRKSEDDKLSIQFIKDYLTINNCYRDNQMLSVARRNINEFNDIVFVWRGKNEKTEKENTTKNQD